jgi:hypothetical protein
LESEVIVKVRRRLIQVQDDNNCYETEYSIDNKKRLECDLKSEKNSVVIHINLENLNGENINEEEVKDNTINIANKVKF